MHYDVKLGLMRLELDICNKSSMIQIQIVGQVSFQSLCRRTKLTVNPIFHFSLFKNVGSTYFHSRKGNLQNASSNQQNMSNYRKLLKYDSIISMKIVVWKL
jgi:hypothetical protein